MMKDELDSKPLSHSKSSFPANSSSLKKCAIYFNLPIKEAADKLKVSRPTISKVLRHYGITRWPYRKLSTKQNLRSGALHNWNESTAMTILERLKNESMEKKGKNLKIENDEGEETSHDVSCLSPCRHSTSSLLTGVKLSACDLNSEMNINVKDNMSTHGNNSLHCSQQYSKNILNQQSTNSQPDTEQKNHNTEDFSAPVKALQSSLCVPSSRQVVLPISLPSDCSQKFQTPLVFTGIATDICYSRYHSDFNPDNILNYGDVSDFFTDDIMGDMSLKFTQELRYDFDNEGGFRSEATIAGNGNNDECVDDLDHQLNGDDFLPSISLETEFGDFNLGIDENDIDFFPSAVHSHAFDRNAPLFSSSSPP